MTNSPLDVNTREMIGKVFFILSISTDPSHTIRLTSAIISLVQAGLHKVNVHKYDKRVLQCRYNWKIAVQHYASGAHGWSSCESILSEVHDFLYDVAMENDIVIIRKEWYNLSERMEAQPLPAVDPMDILHQLR